MNELWQDISLIYEGFNFIKNSIQEELVIISNDNYYVLYHNTDNPIKVRIEKDYNLVRMWSDESTDIDMTSYKLHVEVDGKVELDENHKIELVYKIQLSTSINNQIPL